MDLLPKEIRALGCLIEKQRTTPDAYPLTLNSLRLACNQSTNRDPVVAYDEGEVRDAVRRLERRGLVRFASGAGSRAAKYRHLLAERLPTSDAEQALLCVLMLRGGQTPGELKQRTERMHGFASLAEVEELLERLIALELVARLPRRPGQKEERYGQLLGADATPDGAGAEVGGVEREDASDARFAGAFGGEGAAETARPDQTRPADSAYAGRDDDERAGETVGDRAVPAAIAGLGAEEKGQNADRGGYEDDLAAEVRSLRERVRRLEGGLAEIRVELGIESR